MSKGVKQLFQPKTMQNQQEIVNDMNNTYNLGLQGAQHNREKKKEREKERKKERKKKSEHQKPIGAKQTDKLPHKNTILFHKKKFCNVN